MPKTERIKIIVDFRRLLDMPERWHTAHGIRADLKISYSSWLTKKKKKKLYSL